MVGWLVEMQGSTAHEGNLLVPYLDNCFCCAFISDSFMHTHHLQPLFALLVLYFLPCLPQRNQLHFLWTSLLPFKRYDSLLFSSFLFPSFLIPYHSWLIPFTFGARGLPSREANGRSWTSRSHPVLDLLKSRRSSTPICPGTTASSVGMSRLVNFCFHR